MSERARRIIRTFEESDSGLVVIGEKLIDKPVLREMHRILVIAERVSA
jgi:citrate lyase beta subunit